ncbi:PLP-dependent aminotransferase family protein [Lysinibacillus pakistanensis]|uniref:MocR-like pyridoxine biosynthesis transcription factor PdxR n=1 Tax=Lysinibacillus pakistanensis TaxID=759811 RepID=UPI003D2BE8B0
MIEITPILHKDGPLYLQLYKFIKNEIQVGNIRANSKLPSQRNLAKHLNISRNTVDAAYQQLIAEGYVISKERDGIYVVELEKDFFLKNNQIDNDILAASSNQELEDVKVKYDFNYGDINLKDFPYKIWRKLSLQSLNEEHGYLYLYGDPQGESELRNSISQHLYQARGVSCSAEQIIVGAGLQYLTGLLCNLIGRDVVYGMEDPGYYRVRYLFEDSGIHIQPIPLDNSGISVYHLKKSKVKAVYVTPSHQFPTGIVMPITRRMELLEWAREENAYIIEDDYDGEFRYSGKPIPALHGLDSYENVVYMGTFSKSLIPSIKLSYMVLPMELINLYKKNNFYVQTVSRLHQHTLRLFMESGHWERHLNKSRNIYKGRHLALLNAIHQVMNDDVKVYGSGSGLHILLEPNNHMTEKQLIQTAREQGVIIYPTSVFYANSPKNQSAKVLLGFANLDEASIFKGIELLNKAWFE